MLFVELVFKEGDFRLYTGLIPVATKEGLDDLSACGFQRKGGQLGKEGETLGGEAYGVAHHVVLPSRRSLIPSRHGHFMLLPARLIERLEEVRTEMIRVVHEVGIGQDAANGGKICGYGGLSVRQRSSIETVPRGI